MTGCRPHHAHSEVFFLRLSLAQLIRAAKSPTMIWVGCFGNLRPPTESTLKKKKHLKTPTTNVKFNVICKAKKRDMVSGRSHFHLLFDFTILSILERNET